MSKNFYTYEQQILHLELDKKIQVINKEKLKQILKIYSYYNFVNSTKIHFVNSVTYSNNRFKKVYHSSEIIQWEELYMKSLQVENKVREFIHRTEYILKSSLSYYIGTEYACSSDKVLPIFKKFHHLVLRDDHDNEFAEWEYDTILNNSFRTVHSLMFGSLIHLLKLLPQNIKKEIEDIAEIKFLLTGSGTLKIYSLKELRNGLYHNTPLMILLNHKNKNQRKNRNQLVLKSIEGNEVLINHHSNMKKSIEFLVNQKNEAFQKK